MDGYEDGTGRVAGPRLRGEVIARATAEEAVEALAADLYMQAKNCVRAFGDFHLAVSGGTTPEPLYRLLMTDPNYRELPWKRTHLWVVDERRVGFEDERSNYRMIRELLVEPSDIPGEQAHPIRALEATADTDYEAELREHLGWRVRGHDRLDFVVLGMGADGHTASLFPGSAALKDGGRLVLVNAGAGVTPPDRVTMTFTLLNASRALGVLVLGEKKRSAVARVEAGREGVETLPVMGLDPVGGELRWYLDAAACPARGADGTGRA